MVKEKKSLKEKVKTIALTGSPSFLIMFGCNNFVLSVSRLEYKRVVRE